MENAREQVGRLQASIDRLTRDNIELKNQLIEANRARLDLENRLRARERERIKVNTARKKALGYELGRGKGRTSRVLKRRFHITQTSTKKFFKDGISKVFNVRVLNSGDLVEQLRLARPAVIVRLNKELRRLRGQKFRTTITATLEKTLEFVSDDPEVNIPTQHMKWP